MKITSTVRRPSTPAPASVARAPTASAIGPVSAKDTGVSPIDTNQSTLVTLPSISAGTSVYMSMLQTRSPVVAKPNEKNASTHICQDAPASARPTSRPVPTPHALHMKVTWRRGRPVRLRMTAAAIDPSPPTASTVPKVAARRRARS
jgi:hypothetical protein